MNIIFKKLTEEYIEQVRLWRNSDHVKKYMYTKNHISHDQQKEWFKKIDNDNTRKYFVILTNSILTGLVSFSNIDYKKKSLYWAFYIGNKDKLSSGVGAYMEYYAIDYAISILNMEELYAEVITENSSVISLHKKFGFKKVNKLDRFFDGTIMNITILKLIKSDWEKIKNKFIAIKKKSNYHADE